MDKRSFCEEYKLADTVVIDPKRELLFATAVTNALSGFLNDNFKGAVEVNSTLMTNQCVHICPEYLAMMFKHLLMDIYGRTFLRVKIDTDNKHMLIHISGDTELPLSESERRQMIKTARNAGLDVFEQDGEILLTAGFSEPTVHYIYAVASDATRHMLAKLGEIFFSGAPIGDNFDRPAIPTPDDSKK